MSWKQHPGAEGRPPSVSCTLAGAVDIEVCEGHCRINVGDRVLANVLLASSENTLNGARRIALAVAGAVLDNIRADLQALAAELDE